MARIVLNPFGSFGDLHPYLALAIELARRGHRPLIATSEIYRAKVQGEGIEFAAVRPDIGRLLDDAEFLRKLWHPRLGTEFLMRDYLVPQVGDAYEDLLAACDGADLLVTHIAGYAGPVVAEVLKLPWVSIALQPTVLFSRSDPPVVAQAPWIRHLYPLGVFSAMMQVAHWRTERWAKPIRDLRAKLGLPRGEHPLIEGLFSPRRTLALFSKHFSPPQGDWLAHTLATGFVSYDKRGEGFGEARHTDLEKFLDAGEAPVLFTLGSSAVTAPGRFFEESLAAVRKMGVRAILLVGAFNKTQFPAVDSSKIFFADYVPYSEVMPRVAAIVHQGGIGTTAQALRAGKPTIIVPWAHDQPDNAERCRRLGVSLTLDRGRYSADRIGRALNPILNDSSFAARADALARKLWEEDGVKTACDALG